MAVVPHMPPPSATNADTTTISAMAKPFGIPSIRGRCAGAAVSYPGGAYITGGSVGSVVDVTTDWSTCDSLLRSSFPTQLSSVLIPGKVNDLRKATFVH